MSAPRPLPLWHPAEAIATMGGIGHLPGAPGTWCALVALPLGWLLVGAGGALALGLAALLLFGIGIWAGSVHAKARGLADPSSVVVDEMVGQWLALLALPQEPLLYGAAFVLFRALDMVKPWPIGWLERRVAGGLGIMIDDALAGLIALALLHLGRFLLGG